jgi:hypothetical protein
VKGYKSSRNTLTTVLAATGKDCDDGLIVTFSDGTRAGYVVEELL